MKSTRKGASDAGKFCSYQSGDWGGESGKKLPFNGLRKSLKGGGGGGYRKKGGSAVLIGNGDKENNRGPYCLKGNGIGKNGIVV